jgi:hypothetical protein
MEEGLVGQGAGHEPVVLQSLTLQPPAPISSCASCMQIGAVQGAAQFLCQASKGVAGVVGDVMGSQVRGWRRHGVAGRWRSSEHHTWGAGWCARAAALALPPP